MGSKSGKNISGFNILNTFNNLKQVWQVLCGAHTFLCRQAFLGWRARPSATCWGSLRSALARVELLVSPNSRLYPNLSDLRPSVISSLTVQSFWCVLSRWSEDRCLLLNSMRWRLSIFSRWLKLQVSGTTRLVFQNEIRRYTIVIPCTILAIHTWYSFTLMSTYK